LQFLLYLYNFLRSLFLRGLLNTIRLLREEMVNEKKFGIQTSVIKKSNSTMYFHYQGASYQVLFRIFKELELLAKGYSFVDIGCGKGRVVFMAEHFGFTKVTGIELDEGLLACAKENDVIWKRRHQDSQINFIHVNALDAAYVDEPTVYFLFNPFSEEVLRGVLNRICERTTHELFFVYMNPLYPKPFYEKQMEVMATIKTRWYAEAIIFRQKSA
jgi:SAM-dependent methyltransferase